MVPPPQVHPRSADIAWAHQCESRQVCRCYFQARLLRQMQIPRQLCWSRMQNAQWPPTSTTGVCVHGRHHRKQLLQAGIAITAGRYFECIWSLQSWYSSNYDDQHGVIRGETGQDDLSKDGKVRTGKYWDRERNQGGWGVVFKLLGKELKLSRGGRLIILEDGVWVCVPALFLTLPCSAPWLCCYSYRILG